MKSTGKIGVIIPAVTDSLESELLEEIYYQSARLGYDIIVFTNASNSLDSITEDNYILGEEKIYELLSSIRLDGVLFAAGRFHSLRVIRYITDIIKKSGIPCVVLEKKQDDFPYVYTSQRDEIFAVTEHLITVHGFERIFCLTGPEGSYEAEERLAGFRMAMEHYELDSNNYSYGDFWENSAKLLAGNIAEGKIEMPEAVVCTNDTMAVNLCDALNSHGIKVPEQIAVTGYDGNFEALSYEPVITTVVHKEKELAFKAMAKINEMIKPEISEHRFTKKYNVRYGESCGCLPKRVNSQKKMHYNIVQNKVMQESYLNSNLMVKMSQAVNLKDFTDIIDSLVYLIPELKQLDICLCNNTFPYGKITENSNYTQKMLMLLSKKWSYNEKDNYLFETEIILPALEQEHEPQFVVLLPIHYDSWNIGYMAMYYENGGKYHIDTFLQYWRDSLANGLHTLSNKLSIEHMNKVIEEYSVRDQLTGMLNRKGLFRTADEFITEAEKDGGHCLMLVFTWSQYTTPPLNRKTDIDIVVANALTMLCSSDKLCARTGEKFFAVLMQLDCGEKENEAANRFVVALEQIMQRLQGQPVCPEIPDINCEFSTVTSVNEAEEFLNNIKNLSDNNSQKNCVTDYSVQLKRIRKEIYLSPQTEWESEKLAEKLGISNGYFRKIYKLQFNIPFKEDNINARIIKAKSLLSDTNQTIIEIAAQCGFNNASHFMRTFKAKEGKTAVQFRKGK
ncbi:MAG: substrate-binding domain-containing protein [Oscillospiraceae bacterium]|nr:substrate-binding domain-containing protein [Oscillospiraceae bacterium]